MEYKQWGIDWQNCVSRSRTAERRRDLKAQKSCLLIDLLESRRVNGKDGFGFCRAVDRD